MKRSRNLRASGMVFRLVLVAAVGCAKAGGDATPGATGGAGGTTGTGGGAGTTGTGGNLFTFSDAGPVVVGGVGSSIVPLACTGKCIDFPADPQLDTGVAADAPKMFDAAPAGTGPCIMEPEDGTLFPNNWLRPRIHWTGTTGLHQIRIHSDLQDKDLIAYTTKNEWTLPKDLWPKLATHVFDSDIVVTVRAAGGGASSVKFRIAPVGASGSMVFWSARPTEVGKNVDQGSTDMDTELRAFTVGDEATVSTLRIPQATQGSVDQYSKPRKVRCIGCHVATPDGDFVAFTDHWPWNSVVAGVKPGTTGQSPSWLGAGGLALLNRPWGGMMTFSGAHWKTGDRIMLLSSSLQNPMQPTSMDNTKPANLVWYDLEAASAAAGTGTIARTGDNAGAACPSWSHDGNTIVYASTMGGNMDGRLEKGRTDLYAVPYGNRAGGAATPIAGASTEAFEEYYPAHSPDDKFVAYNRVPRNERMYGNKNAEVLLVPAAGGDAVSLAANKPPACSGKSTPGVNNHWPRWSPQVQTANGKTYYWLVFSSNRTDIPPVKAGYVNGNPSGNGPLVEISQLYVTGVVVDGTGKVETYPATYLWNQPANTVNTTPAWDVIKVPPVIIN